MIAVNSDIEPWNADLVNWAITYRCQPHRDVRITKGHTPDRQDCPIQPPPEGPLISAFNTLPSDMPESSCLLMDTTIK